MKAKKPRKKPRKKPERRKCYNCEDDESPLTKCCDCGKFFCKNCGTGKDERANPICNYCLGELW